MPSKETGELGSAGVLDGDEQIHVVDDPAGTAASEFTTPDDIVTYAEGSFLLLDTSNDPLTGTLTINEGTGGTDSSTLQLISGAGTYEIEAIASVSGGGLAIRRDKALVIRDGDAVNTVTVLGGTIINEDGSPNGDLRVEGDTDDNLLVCDASADRVGLGVAAPGAKLHVVNDGSGFEALFDRYQTNAGGMNLSVRKARGSLATPTSVNAGDGLRGDGAYGYDGTSFDQVGESRFEAQSVAAGNISGKWKLRLSDTAGTLQDRLSIDEGGAVSIEGSNNELRFYEGANYVGFEAPALAADQIWVLPEADGNNGDLLCTDGSGALGWAGGAFEKALSFDSPAGASGTFYFGGFYDFASSDNDFNPSVNFGTANSAYAAHFFIVSDSPGASQTVVRVSGTSITDDAVRTTSDTEDLTIAALGGEQYLETSKKWIGQVSVVKISGNDVDCNYGWCKYWDNANTDFNVVGVDVTWLGGANDTGANIVLRHHKSTGWTYNAGSTPTPPAAVADMQADYVTEYQVKNGDHGAYKRTNLSAAVAGGSSEGTIWEIVTTANKTFELGNILMRILPATT